MPINISQKDYIALGLDVLSLSMACSIGAAAASTAGVSKLVGGAFIATVLLIDKVVASQFNKFIKPPNGEGLSRIRKVIVFTAYGLAWGASKAAVLALSVSLCTKVASIVGVSLTAATLGRIGLGLCEKIEKSTVAYYTTLYCVAIHTIANDIRAEPEGVSFFSFDSYDDIEEGEGVENVDEVLHDHRSDPEQQCTVCLEPLEERVVNLACTHLFHRECVSTWLTANASCPNCRHDPREDWVSS
jgi:hypothetical protein